MDGEKQDGSSRDENEIVEQSDIGQAIRPSAPRPVAEPLPILMQAGQHKHQDSEKTSPRVEWNLEAALVARSQQRVKDGALSDRVPQARP